MRKNLMHAVAAIAALAAAAPASATTYQCTFTQKQSCAAEGCKPVSPSIWVKLDDAAGIYSRCDSRGCDDHRAVFSYRGATHSVEIPGAGAFVKFMDGGEAVEVASQMTMVYVSHGICKVD